MNMKKILMSVVSMACLIMLSAAPASAYTIWAQEYVTGGAAINATPFFCVPAAASTAPPFGKACAKFTYSGPLNFDNPAPQNITPLGDLNSDFFNSADITSYSNTSSGSVYYSPCGCIVADFNTLANFLASSGSIYNDGYASSYTVDLGTLAAGTVLTITHDDGIALYYTSTMLPFGNVTNGPTSVITDTATVGMTDDVFLYYTRQNGTPSILQVAVPEPASLAVFGAALIAMAGAAGWMRRDRKSA
jgi:hypothetical protein